MKSKTVAASTRDSEPSPAAIIGGILALGVVRAIARAQREQDQTTGSAPKAAPLACRRKHQ